MSIPLDPQGFVNTTLRSTGGQQEDHTKAADRIPRDGMCGNLPWAYLKVRVMPIPSV
jgi:hypothetical protein